MRQQRKNRKDYSELEKVLSKYGVRRSVILEYFEESKDEVYWKLRHPRNLTVHDIDKLRYICPELSFEQITNLARGIRHKRNTWFEESEQAKNDEKLVETAEKMLEVMRVYVKERKIQGDASKAIKKTASIDADMKRAGRFNTKTLCHVTGCDKVAKDIRESTGDWVLVLCEEHAEMIRHKRWGLEEIHEQMRKNNEEQGVRRYKDD